MNRFERILIDYGQYIFSMVFHVALKRERYEDCAKMKEAASKYGINLHAAEEDWVSSGL